MPGSEFDGRRFNENVARFPREERLRYAGRYVAWNPEGTRILADSDNEADLYTRLDAAGIPLDQVAVGYVPSGDESYMH